MTHHTSATRDDATDTGGSSRWDRFHDWRRGRPFLGGVLLMVSGVLIAYVPLQYAAELLLVGGAFTFVGLVVAVSAFLCGLFALMRPDLSTMIGVTGVAMSILSIFGALGGLVVGMVVGIVGGNLCIAWAEVDRDGGTGRNDDDEDGGLESLLIEEHPDDTGDRT